MRECQFLDFDTLKSTSCKSLFSNVNFCKSPTKMKKHSKFHVQPHKRRRLRSYPNPIKTFSSDIFYNFTILKSKFTSVRRNVVTLFVEAYVQPRNFTDIFATWHKSSEVNGPTYIVFYPGLNRRCMRTGLRKFQLMILRRLYRQKPISA